MSRNQQIREQCNDIEMRTLDTVILLQTVIEKLDAMPTPDAEVIRHTDAMNCFVTCALRNLELLKEHNQHVFALLTETGDQQ